MREDLRDSGIDVVGGVDWGCHFCVFYHGKEELESLLVSYVKAGLEGNEACVWVTSHTIRAEEAKAALEKAVPDFDARVKSGQIEIIRAKDWYIRNGKFDAKEVFAGWKEKATKAKERGFKGLRATGDTSWLSNEEWEKFVDYESAIESEIRGKEMIVLCSYSLDLWEAYQMIDVVSTHEFALIKKDGAWKQIENSERRKSMEDALEAQEKYRRVVDNVRVAVYSALPDESSTTTLLTPRIKEITGYPAEKFLQDPGFFMSIILPEDRPRLLESLKEHREKQIPLKVQYRILSKAGDVRWIKDEASPVKDKHGNIVRIDGFVEDITDLKELEQSLESRTRQLDAANKELEAFSYSVSHDLRAPLRRIDGFSEILQKEKGADLGPDGQKHLDRIQRSVREMDSLIENLLRLSRTNTTELRIQKVDLSDLAREVVEPLRSSSPSRRVKIKIHEGIAAMGDPNLLRIALQNLIGNAWKFTGGRDESAIEFGAKMIDGQRTFFVKDSGVGFDMAHAYRLFVPFQRLHSQSEFPGDGIGLALVQRIVIRHGGRIWAEGEVGKGATFYFTLAAEGS